MKDQDGNWTPRAKQLVWQKAPYVDINHQEYGKYDSCKACINEEYYGDRNSGHGWEPSLQFEEGIEKTVRWYLNHQDWMDNITSGDYERYSEEMYKNH